MQQGKIYDYLVLGAGPAGLQVGYFLQSMGYSYVIFEEAERAGSFYEVLPRHGKMISINKRYTGYEQAETQLRYDWNSLLCDNPQLRVRHYSKEYFPQTADYQRYLIDFATYYQLHIRYRTRIVHVKRDEQGFRVQDQQGQEYQGKRLIIATGLGQTPGIPALEGSELAEHYRNYSVCPEDYIDQRVLIIGKGNGAFETANALVPTARIIHMCSPNSVRMAWETHFMGHVRTVNAEFLDTFYLKGQNAILDARVERLERGEDGIVAHISYTHAGGQTMQLVYDRVLLCTGFRFDSSIFAANCQPETVRQGKLPAMTAEWESTNIKDLYFAGTLMQMRDYHKTMSNVIHGFRFNIQFLCHRLAEKYHQQAISHYHLPLESATLTRHFFTRASVTAALFLQPGFLCDLGIVRRQEQQIGYYEHVPVDYIRDVWCQGDEEYYTLTLEYGRHDESSRHQERDPDPANAHNDFYLHPVIRYFQGPQQLGEQHIAENLENNWLPGKRSFIRTTEVLGKHSAQEMLDHTPRLEAFLQTQLKA